MSQHHRDGIAMMELATEKAQDAKIKAMAEKGIRDHKQEIEQMQDLSKELGGDGTSAVDMHLRA